MESNTSHTLFLVTKGSATLFRHTLRQDRKAPQQQRVKSFLSNYPASGKCATTTAQTTCQAQQQIQMHFPGNHRYRPQE